MAVIINTNLAALVARKNLEISQSSLATSIARLSSGSRITKAADDAAGLAISEKLNAQIRGLGQASRNASNGISVLSTADGALVEVTNNIIRMRELAVQSSSGDLGSSERDNLNSEYQQLLQEIDRITTSTKYNGIALFSSLAQGISIQIGIDSGGANAIDLKVGGGSKWTYYSNTRFVDYGYTNTDAGPPTVPPPDPSKPYWVDYVDGCTYAPGQYESLLPSESYGSSGWDGNDVDSHHIDHAPGIYAYEEGWFGTSTISGTTIAGADGSTAQTTMSKLDSALANVTTTRGTLGALQNRLESIIRNLSVSIENTSAANSRIRDVDVSEETAYFTKSQILVQAAISVLSQANQQPSIALSLLSSR